LTFGLDYKNSCGVIANSIEELAYNATAVSWSPLNQPVRVRIRITLYVKEINKLVKIRIINVFVVKSQFCSVCLCDRVD